MKKSIKNTQDKQIRIRNAYFEVAKTSGAMDRVSRLLSANYILHSHSVYLLDDVEGLLESHGLVGGKIISAGKRLNNAFKEYFDEFSGMVGKDKVQDWADDLTQFGKIFEKFSGLDPNFSPDMSSVDIEAINEKYGVNIKLEQ